MILLTAAALGAATGAGAWSDGPFACVVKPSAEVEVAAPEEGVVAEVFVGRGDLVRRGAPLARLADGPERASAALARRRARSADEIAAARAQRDLLAGQVERAETLLARDLTPVSAVEAARAELAEAERVLRQALRERELAALELDRAEAVLARLSVQSPVSGVVTARHVDPGERSDPRGPLVTIAALDPLHVETYLPVDLHGRVSRGDVATIMPEEPIGGRHAARVDVVDRVYDAASGTFGVRLILPNPDRALPAGVRCELRLAAPRPAEIRD